MAYRVGCLRMFAFTNKPTNVGGGTKMLTTQDIAVINKNMPNKFDVIITQQEDEVWTVCLIINNTKQELVTWAGHKKAFKNFETVLTTLKKYCFNARNVTIYLSDFKQKANMIF